MENGKIVYINEKGEIATEREVDIKTEDFITEWAVAANDIIVLPIAIGYTKDNDFIVDWGDGSSTEKINDTETALNVRPQHQYTEKGSYKIKISGKCSYFTLSSIAKEYPEQLKKLTKLICSKSGIGLDENSKIMTEDNNYTLLFTSAKALKNGTLLTTRTYLGETDYTSIKDNLQAGGYVLEEVNKKATKTSEIDNVANLTNQDEVKTHLESNGYICNISED